MVWYTIYLFEISKEFRGRKHEPIFSKEGKWCGPWKRMQRSKLCTSSCEFGKLTVEFEEKQVSLVTEGASAFRTEYSARHPGMPSLSRRKNSRKGPRRAFTKDFSEIPKAKRKTVTKPSQRVPVRASQRIFMIQYVPNMLLWLYLTLELLHQSKWLISFVFAIIDIFGALTTWHDFENK